MRLSLYDKSGSSAACGWVVGNLTFIHYCFENISLLDEKYYAYKYFSFINIIERTSFWLYFM